MYVTSAVIQSIKSLNQVAWRVSEADAAGWHTILGVNGSGKSTFIRAIAAAMLGPSECRALNQNWASWLRQGEQSGDVLVEVVFNRQWDALIPWTGSHGGYQPPAEGTVGCTGGISFSPNGILDRPDEDWTQQAARTSTLWSTNEGFFSASFGPFRRFTGGGLEFESRLKSSPKLARHISAFDDQAALSSGLEWLRQQKFAQLESQPPGESTVDHVIAFVNQEGFLPDGAKLDSVSSNGVDFVDGNGAKVGALDMSDGFRSLLSLAFELIRLLHNAFPSRSLFDKLQDGSVVITPPGVVLIDEIDAHLHPTWQRAVGPWLTKHFPNIQFVVSTHSPFVCQASIRGSIFVLESPGGDGHGSFLEGKQLDRILYGDILDAYSTDVFGEGMTRSEESQAKMARLAELNTKSVFRALTGEEVEERSHLRLMMSTTPNPLLEQELA